MTGKDDVIFSRGSLMGHVSVISFTACIGMMAIFAVDFIDMNFISTLGTWPLVIAGAIPSAQMVC